MNTGQIVYGTHFEDSRGVWQVEANQTVTFTPTNGYGGGSVWMEYQITDSHGRTAQSWIDIGYPVYVRAGYSQVQESNTSITIEYDVLANVQTGNGSSVTEFALITYDNNGQMIYVNSYASYEGTWSIVDGKIRFTPNENFNGGTVHVEYRIGDGNNHYSQGGFSIEYPLYIYAAHYNVSATTSTETVIIDVYAQSIIPAEGVSSFQFVNVDQSGNLAILGENNVNWNGGTWTVADGVVTFVPDSSFGGGSVHIAYMISDSLGHSSVGHIQITYRAEATAVCPVTTLYTIETVYNAMTSNLSFAEENGRREFNIELDKETYVVDSDLFDSSTAVSAHNPMYQVKYGEESRMTSSGDTFVKVRLRGNILELFDSNSTWLFREPTSENDRGYKFSGIDGEGGGSYVLDTGVYTLSMEGEGEVFTFKLVRDITESEMETVLNNAGIALTLETGDTAQLLFGTGQDEYDWWGTIDNEDHGSLNAFIVANEYNSTQWFNGSGVLRTHNWQKVIIFAEGSAGQSSGTLVEIERQTSALLTDTAGTWSIETITDQEGDTYDIIVAETNLCGYESKIFRVDVNSLKILQGQRDVAGTIESKVWVSDSLKEKLNAYFISVAPLDINPAHASSPQITESMLSDGKIFYSVEDQGDGTTHYRKMTIVSSNELTRQLMIVNASGDIIGNTTETYSYEVDRGRIVLQGNNGDIKIGLNSEPGAGDWNVTFYTWDVIWGELWLVNEPSDFPN